MRCRRGILMVVCACFGGGAVRARAEDAELGPVHVSAPFWQAARDPDAPRVEALLRQGRARLSPALGLGILLGSAVSAHRRAGIENALARFERALSIAPHHPEALYLTGKALALWERRTPQGGVERRSREAIARFEELMALDPLYEAEDVAFELGVLHTREGDFARAAAAYERALALRMEAGSRSVVLGNLAEVTMMREDLEHALDLYAQAVSEGNREERVLGMWGMAVVLDRLGEKGESLERAKQALRDDVRPMGVLKQSSIFFVPAYEAHYYDGLGFRALAELEGAEGEKAEYLVRGFARTLSRVASPNALMALKQLLVSLEEEGHRARIEPLYQALDRAARKLPKAAGPALTGEEPEASEANALKAVVYSVQALRSFARYLDRGGDAGPWAADARAHLEELAGWFSGRPSGARTD